jgi:hypothetical protein
VPGGHIGAQYWSFWKAWGRAREAVFGSLQGSEVSVCSIEADCGDEVPVAAAHKPLAAMQQIKSRKCRVG